MNQAYLYWHGPTNSTDPTFNANINFAGTAISGTNIGFSDDNFWSQANSQAYRSDVTSLVSGNGTFSISGLFPNNSNGASLVVFFDDGNNANNRDIVIFDGNDANFANAFDPVGWSATLSGINFPGGTASMLLGVSDGQNFGGLDDPSLLINGSTLVPQGDIFQGTSVPNTAGTSVTNGALWDLVSFDITSFLTVGPNTLSLTTGPSPGDALSLIHLTIDLPAGSAPEQPDQPGTVPEPGTIALFSIGLIGLGLRRRCIK